MIFGWWRYVIESIWWEEEEEEDGRKKKTGIKIDFSIMLAVSRGRHMF